MKGAKPLHLFLKVTFDFIKLKYTLFTRFFNVIPKFINLFYIRIFSK